MNTLNRCKPLLGTYVELELQGSCSDSALLDLSQQAFAAIEQVEALMSFHRADSELSRLNRQAHKQPCLISEPMHKVLSLALKLSRLSDGLFDVSIAPGLIRQGGLPQVDEVAADSANWQAIELGQDSIAFKQPLLIDLGGIAKGYAVDCAMAVLPKDVEVVINAGGDLKMSHWQDQQTAVRLPHDPGQTVALPMMAASLASSANYFTDFSNADCEQQGSAMILPASGEPVRQDFSISVYADDCILADALTKWAFLDQQAGDNIRALDALAIKIGASGEVLAL